MKAAEIKLHRNSNPLKRSHVSIGEAGPVLELHPLGYMHSEQDGPSIEIYPVIIHKQNKGKLGRRQNIPRS